MTTGTLRVEIHPPGTTPSHRSPAPLASATLPISGTTPTDPNALPTVASVFPSGTSFTGSCVVFVTPDSSLQSTNIWCSIGKTPDVTAEPRHMLVPDNTGRTLTFLIDIGSKDRMQFAATA